MSPFLAILAVTGIFAALSAPLLLAAWKGAAGPPVAFGYAALLSLTAGFHSGLFRSADLPADVAEVAPSVSRAQCREVLSLLEQEGMVMDRRTPPRLVVIGAQWSQLPEQGRRVITDCIQHSWPAGTGPLQLEVRGQ